MSVLLQLLAVLSAEWHIAVAAFPRRYPVHASRVKCAAGRSVDHQQEQLTRQGSFKPRGGLFRALSLGLLLGFTVQAGIAFQRLLLFPLTFGIFGP